MTETGNPVLNIGRLAGIRALMGYIQNGTGTTVTLWQDDVTGEFTVTVGAKTYHATGFLRALDAAIADNLDKDSEPDGIY